jgi:citrate lyase beta subunit
VRHFTHLGGSDLRTLFAVEPQPFSRDDGIELLSVALGATLYIPADRPSLDNDIVKQAAAGVTSVVVCLEDAIPDSEVLEAEINLIAALRKLHRDEVPLPLLFVRVREAAQVEALVAILGSAGQIIDGFVLPKFTADGAEAYWRVLDHTSKRLGRRILAMPVLESSAVLYAETRVDELMALRSLLQRERSRILAVRLGATDLCSLYGLRRSPDLSIYDVKVVSHLVADVVNLLGRADGTAFTITGPVWEYYAGMERILKPQLRSTPFTEHNEGELRYHLLSQAIDGLIRETQLDKANGLTGKTAIHPSHVAVVNALSVVTYEEHRDATDLLQAPPGGGVLASGHQNKMNEVRPHTTWARQTMLRAQVFGVAAEGVSFVDLLAASLP